MSALSYFIHFSGTHFFPCRVHYMASPANFSILISMNTENIHMGERLKFKMIEMK